MLSLGLESSSLSTSTEILLLPQVPLPLENLPYFSQSSSEFPKRFSLYLYYSTSFCLLLESLVAPQVLQSPESKNQLSFISEKVYQYFPKCSQ